MNAPLEILKCLILFHREKQTTLPANLLWPQQTLFFDDCKNASAVWRMLYSKSWIRCVVIAVFNLVFISRESAAAEWNQSVTKRHCSETSIQFKAYDLVSEYKECTTICSHVSMCAGQQGYLQTEYNRQTKHRRRLKGNTTEKAFIYSW